MEPIAVLEFLRPQHGDEEVNQQTQGDDADKYVFHGLKLSTRVGVNDADGEKRQGHGYENHVLHDGLLFKAHFWHTRSIRWMSRSPSTIKIRLSYIQSSAPTGTHVGHM
jgi:hypothetical protein